MELQGLQRDVDRVKVLREGEMVYSGKARDDPSHGGKSAKGAPEERGQELRLHGTITTKERIKVVKISRCFAKVLKASQGENC